MKRVLWLFLLAFFAVLIMVSSPATADQPSIPPDANAMTYTEWCQHMDQLTQDLRIATRNALIRGSIDFAVQFVGLELIANGVQAWQQTVGGLLILAGFADYFIYTMPPASEAILDYKMWKEAGAAHMWLYPCTASTRE